MTEFGSLVILHWSFIFSILTSHESPHSMSVMSSLTGQFLIASHKLLDANFAKSVVLIVRHDDDGAFGLIVNRPMPVTVAKALETIIDGAGQADMPIYAGGPCEGPVFVAHANAGLGGESAVPGVFITTDSDAIQTLLIASPDDIKFFASYSGWSPGQIEGELAEGHWLMFPAAAAEVFSIADHLWQRLMTRVNLSKYIDPSKIPDDPSVN